MEYKVGWENFEDRPKKKYGWFFHEKELKAIIDETNPKIILELGAQYGHLSLWLSKNTNKQVHIFSADTWENTGREDYYSSNADRKMIENHDLYQTFMANLIGEREKVSPVHMPPSEVLCWLKTRKKYPDLIYIDCNYELNVRDTLAKCCGNFPNATIAGDNFSGKQKIIESVALQYKRTLNNENEFWSFFPTQKEMQQEKSLLRLFLKSKDNPPPTIAKYPGKLDFFFANLPIESRQHIKVDEQAMYSITEHKSADAISKYILNLPGITKESIVSDLMACIGGNTSSFARHFSHVNSVELNNERFNMLKNNVVDVMGLNNITFIKGDLVKEVLKLKQDVIFIDPGWGGLDYKKSEFIDLFINKIPLSTIVKDLLNHAKYVVIKIPTNFDRKSFESDMKACATITYETKNLKRMEIAIVKPLAKSKNN